jgi:hypothetical protein
MSLYTSFEYKIITKKCLLSTLHLILMTVFALWVAIIGLAAHTMIRWMYLGVFVTRCYGRKAIDTGYLFTGGSRRDCVLAMR